MAIEKGCKIIVLMNPPYGRANEGGRTSTVSKGSANTFVGEIMKQNKIGASSAQLYSQFIYQIAILSLTWQSCHVSLTQSKGNEL
jgi:hypothetical protein